MSLTQSISTYLANYEGHTQYEGPALLEVLQKLSLAPISEINTEYNALSQQHLWIQPLLDAFHDELLDRLLDKMTFSLSVSWRASGLAVFLQIGSEEIYPVLDPEGNLVPLGDTEVFSYTLTNDSFTDVDERYLLGYLLDLPPIGSNSVLGATLEKIGEKFRILAIGDLQIAQPEGTIVPVQLPVQIKEDPDYRLTRAMYLGVKSENPGVLDLGAELTINQLVDLPEAYNIVYDGGVTFEGDLVLKAEPDEEEAEMEIEPE